ncbi:MAG: hypothetical protein ACTSQG_08230 [Promethearchaeota archaeon]
MIRFYRFQGKIHIQQIHDPRERGTIFINKYEQLGAHLLQYQIKTNWKAFNRGLMVHISSKVL